MPSKLQRADNFMGYKYSVQRENGSDLYFEQYLQIINYTTHPTDVADMSALLQTSA